MTVERAAVKYRIPNYTTKELIEGCGSSAIVYGDCVIIAGYYGARAEGGYWAAVYRHIDEDLSREGTLEMQFASAPEFDDDGHAIEWAINRIQT